MDRSLSRFSVLVGSAVLVGSLLAGCAATVPGPVIIGVPPTSAGAPAPAAGDFLAGLEQAVASELAAIDSTQTDNTAPEPNIVLQALNNKSTLLQAEAYNKLQYLGRNQLAKRVRLTSALIVDVKGSAYLSGVEVNGTPLSTWTLGMLGRVNGQLQAQASSLQSATLVDALRSVITSIGPSTRVLGLVEPIVHLVIAGGEELNAANLLETQYEALSRKVDLNHHDPNFAAETARLRDLAANIANIRANATAAVEAVMGLSPAGYPGNKSTILSARAELVQVRSSFGPLNTGVGDVNGIDRFLSARAS